MDRQEVTASVLNYARSQLGVTELTGNNDGIPAERYMQGDKLPWCAGFVLWVFRQAGYQLPGNQFKDRAVLELETQLSLLACELESPVPGALIFFRKGHSSAGPSGHVGIIEDVKSAKGDEGFLITTIEGNSSNRVKRGRYDSSNPFIKGYYLWPKDDIDGTYTIPIQRDTK